MGLRLALGQPISQRPPEDELNVVDAGDRNAAKAGVLSQWQRPEMYARFQPPVAAGAAR